KACMSLTKSTSRLVHFTSEASYSEIMKSGQLIGNKGIFAAPEWVGGLSTKWRALLTGLPPWKLAKIVQIPEESLGLFRRPLPIGPYSAIKYFSGVRYAPSGVLNLGTGAFTPTFSVIGPR